ncbi:MAG: hypothetical protein H7Y18_10175 [Clostridiaceae bacterium]|nr:hypothetical protein [Clostridiaceae bacterium]
MSNTLFDEKGHLTEVTLRALKCGLLEGNELAIVSEHICSCESCSSAFANSFKDDELAKAPLGFEEEIQCKLKKKKDIEFMFYSLRVTIAASIALVFVFSNTLNLAANTKVGSIKAPNLSIVNSINTDINNFSEKIINLEVFNNEKEKK